MSALPTFGQRAAASPAPPTPLPARAGAEASPPRAEQGQTHAAPLAELHTLCLSRMDPVAVASTPPDRLALEVERLIADIATELRIQLNGREQRSLAAELVHDMLGLGPLETLLQDELIADIMVNGPHRIFIERRGKVELSPVRFRDAAHLSNVEQAAAFNAALDGFLA